MKSRLVHISILAIISTGVMIPLIQGGDLPGPVGAFDSGDSSPDDLVNFTTYDKGFYSGIRYGDSFYAGEHFVIRNQTEWEIFWADHSGGATPTDINWSTDMVLAAIQGFVPTCCSSHINFTHGSREGDNLTVWIQRTYAHGMLQIFTNPYHIITIERVPNVIFRDPLFDDDHFPPYGSITINDGDEWTNSTSVRLYLQFQDDMSGVSKIRLSNDGIWDTEPWEIPTWFKSWALEPGDGVKTVYYQIVDSVGHLSFTYTDYITLDATPPTLSLTINDGNLWTNSIYATLNIASWDNGSGVSQIRFSDDGLWDTEQWEAVKSNRNWNLTAGDGPKIIWCQIIDNANNVFETLAVVGLDTSPPTGYVYNPHPGSVRNSASFVVSWAGSDLGSGIAVYDVQYRDDTSGTWSDWLLQTSLTSALFGPFTPVNVKDGHTYYFHAKARDKAGNTGTYSGGLGDTFVTIDLQAPDTDPPIISNIMPPDSSETNDNTPLIYAEYHDASGIDDSSVVLRIDGYDVSSSAIITISNIVYIPTTPLSDGSHSMYLYVRDTSPNANEATVFWEFTVSASLIDTSPPTITNLLPLEHSAVKNSTPMIEARYADFSGIDLSSVILKLDGIDVTSSAAITQYGVTYQVNSALADGSHLVSIEVRDNSSNKNRATRFWSFTVVYQDDIDVDGLPDDWETMYLGDLSMDGSHDPDNDGLNNLQEYNLGTNPLNDDTDGDGILDLDDPNPLVPGPSDEDSPLSIWLWILLVFTITLSVVMIVSILKIRSRKEQNFDKEEDG